MNDFGVAIVHDEAKTTDLMLKVKEYLVREPGFADGDYKDATMALMHATSYFAVESMYNFFKENPPSEGPDMVKDCIKMMAYLFSREFQEIIMLAAETVCDLAEMKEEDLDSYIAEIFKNGNLS